VNGTERPLNRDYALSEDEQRLQMIPYNRTHRDASGDRISSIMEGRSTNGGHDNESVDDHVGAHCMLRLTIA